MMLFLSIVGLLGMTHLFAHYTGCARGYNRGYQDAIDFVATGESPKV